MVLMQRLTAVQKLGVSEVLSHGVLDNSGDQVIRENPASRGTETVVLILSLTKGK